MNSLEELKALLFGHAPYGREGAPEPELLGDLAAALPESTVAEAIRTISGIGVIDDTQRFQALAALLERAAGAREKQELATTILLHPGVVDFLPERLLPGALEAVRAVEWETGGRTVALVAFARRVPSIGEKVLLDETVAAASWPDFVYPGARVFRMLTRHLHTNLPENVTATFVERFRAIEEPASRAELLVDLAFCTAPSLRQNLLSPALSACQDVADPITKAGLLADLTLGFPELPRKEVLLQAYESVCELETSAYGRSEALARLSLSAPPPLKDEILSDAIAPHERGEFLWPEPHEALGRAFASIAEEVPEALKGEFKKQVQALDLSADSLIDLAPYLSHAQLQTAVEATPNLDEAEWLRAWAKLAPRLSEGILAQALRIVGTSEKEDRFRALALATMAPRLPASLSPEAVRTARCLESDWWQSRALTSLFPYLHGATRDAVVDEASRVSGEHMRELLREQSERLQVALLRDVVGSIWSRYGGAPPPSPEPQPEVEGQPLESPTEAPSEAEETSEAPRMSQERPDADWESYEDRRYEMERRDSERRREELLARTEYWQDERWERQKTWSDRRHWDGTFSLDSPEMGQPYGDDEIAGESGPQEPVVNTGFASPQKPDVPLDSGRSLSTRRKYFFWVEIGEPVAGAIDLEPTTLEIDKLPPSARLKVALFSFEGEIGITPGADIGEIQVQPDRSVIVVRPAAKPDRLKDPDLLARRLFFPVKTPRRSGTFRLRCNFYFEQVLVQSHLVEVGVESSERRSVSRRVEPMGERSSSIDEPPGDQRLKTTLEYRLSRSLRAEHLELLESHRLSIMLNDNGNGTHGFRFFGLDEEAEERFKEEFKEEASFTGQELQNLIEKARGGLRAAAWGDKEPWDGQEYRYRGARDLDRLRFDLVGLAKWGYRFYDQAVGRLAGGARKAPVARRKAERQLRGLMQKPGIVQLASKESARHVVPISIVYDHRLDDTARRETYGLCPKFTAALDRPEPLTESSCFKGACPSEEDDKVVCPSGFWGYRHNIGMPVSVGDEGLDAALEIRYREAPELCVAVSTDPNFVRRPEHETTLKGLRQGLGWHHADTRDEALELMDMAFPHLVYFYCHGGVHDDVPYLEVGSPRDEEFITRALLRNRDVFWTDPQPLVFINGCHTTALEPEVALDLVSGFVETANAAGVIGTEITVFEPLACSFAENCLEHFLGGDPIGESVRKARLALLKDGNPLGLVYIPFVVASLALKETPEDEQG